MTNSVTIASGGVWYPFSESGAPTQNEQDAYFPLRTYVLNNKSGEEYEIILDSPISEPKLSFIVPNGNSNVLKEEENINYNTIVLKNNGSLTTAANELTLVVRNY